MWSHAPRRSHDQSRDSSPDDDDDEPRRRTSSDATPRPANATTRFLADPDPFASSKRLGFLADRLTSSLSATTLHPHAHSRAESSSAATAAPAPQHTSPSKASYGRTYDSKLVTREMHRLGNLAHLPSALAPQLSAAPSATSLSLPSAASISQASVSASSSTDPWGALHVHVLPLFNGEHLRIPIEDLNVLVKKHIQSVVSSFPSKAVNTLENDASELIAAGMVTLNAKLKGIDDDKLLARVVEIWGFFWDQVLTYLEGVLLPLQTDPLLSSLYRAPKAQRATSPNRQHASKSSSSNLLSSTTYHIDVRCVALKSFRDRVILPPFQRLYARLSMPNRQDNFQDTTSYQQPRLQQMLLVLSAQSRSVPLAFSLTTPAPQPTAGEAAIRDLLRLVRNPRPAADVRNLKFKNSPAIGSRTPTFLTGGLPRDRRGRVAMKGSVNFTAADDDILGDDTPRMNAGSYVLEIEREREREFLEALRSPDIDHPNTRASFGGWGLGAGHEDNARGGDDEEEESDWDHSQLGHTEARRRMT